MQPDYSRQLLLKEIGAAGQAALGAQPRADRGRRRSGQSGAAISGRRRSGILGVDRCRQPGCQQPASAADLRARRCRRSRKRTWRARRSQASIPACTSRRMRSLQRRQRAGVDPRSRHRRRLHATIFAPNTSSTMPPCLRSGRPYSPASISTKDSCRCTSRSATHACLRCLWPDATADGVVGNCAEAGVLGPVPGAFGALQALLALKILLGDCRAARRRAAAAGFHEFLQHQAQGAAPRRVHRARLRAYPRACRRGRATSRCVAIAG